MDDIWQNWPVWNSQPSIWTLQFLDEISDMTRCMYDCVLSRTEDTMDVKNMFNLAKVLNYTYYFSENNFGLSSFLMTLLIWQRFWITKKGLILEEISDMTRIYISTSIYDYRIVASTNTCYYSENQIFHFLKSGILTCRNFF